MLLSTLISLSALAAAAAAVGIQGFRGTCDDGPNTYIKNLPHDICQLIEVSGAVRFTEVPPGSKGHIYVDGGCRTFALEGGSGTYCLSGAGAVTSANWFTPSRRLVVRELETREMTSGFEYTTPEGIERHITVLVSDFKVVFALFADGDWDTLAAYPDGMS